MLADPSGQGSHPSTTRGPGPFYIHFKHSISIPEITEIGVLAGPSGQGSHPSTTTGACDLANINTHSLYQR